MKKIKHILLYLLKNRFVKKNLIRVINNYQYLKQAERFQLNANSHDAIKRKIILKKFEIIDDNIASATHKTDMLHIANSLLSIDLQGDLVECGCNQGNSTAKLSILAKILGKKLYIFDSFEGLPETKNHTINDFHVRQKTKRYWQKGQYCGELDVVKRNIEKYGEIDSCIFKKGWFADTLIKDNLPNKICLSFTDCDLAQSAFDCLINLWPLTVHRGLFYSHDVAFQKVLEILYSENTWKNHLNEFPPVLYGAGYGVSDSSPHLGFMVKGGVDVETTSNYFL